MISLGFIYPEIYFHYATMVLRNNPGLYCIYIDGERDVLQGHMLLHK